jgi:hypothetical protein
MKIQIASTAAAALSLVLASGPLTAAEQNWSASIGNGHTSETATTVSATADGAPSSPHWTAAIGTGRTTEGARSDAASPVRAEQSLAQAHWTSQIGTGHASEATGRAVKKAAGVLADVSSSTSPASGK